MAQQLPIPPNPPNSLRLWTLRRGQPVDPVSGLSRREDVFSSRIQAGGVLLRAAAVAVLMVQAAWSGQPRVIVGTAIYGATLLMLYGTSAGYHAARRPKLKRVLLKLDHISIYLLIAGTYTPLTLVTLNGGWGWSLFGVVWGLAGLGAIWKLFAAGRLPVLSTVLYVVLGWVLLVGIVPLVQALPPTGVWLLVGGGVTYTVGAVVFLARRIPFNHAIWQGLVFTGAALHYSTILFFVVPHA